MSDSRGPAIGGVVRHRRRGSGGGGRPLYARALRLRHVQPGSLLCLFLFEGTVAITLLLAFADLVSWWGVVLVPLAVAVMVKLNDVVAGFLPNPHAVRRAARGGPWSGRPRPVTGARDGHGGQEGAPGMAWPSGVAGSPGAGAAGSPGAGAAPGSPVPAAAAEALRAPMAPAGARPLAESEDTQAVVTAEATDNAEATESSSAPEGENAADTEIEDAEFWTDEDGTPRPVYTADTGVFVAAEETHRPAR